MNTQAAISFSDPKPPRFKFNRVDDCLDLEPNFHKYFQNVLSVHNANVVERYKQVETELVVALRTGAKSDKYHLVFSAVPDVRVGHLKVPSAVNIDAEAHIPWPMGITVLCLSATAISLSAQSKSSPPK